MLSTNVCQIGKKIVVYLRYADICGNGSPGTEIKAKKLLMTSSVMTKLNPVGKWNISFIVIIKLQDAYTVIYFIWMQKLDSHSTDRIVNLGM